MVKQGFKNLTSEEQDQVLEAAIDEFSEHDFESASLNQIIQNAGISKGSMYHYFQNKESLYICIIEKAITEKKRFMLETLESQKVSLDELGFFELIASQLELSILFGQANPRYHKISLYLHNMEDTPLKEKIWGRFDSEFDDLLEAMVTKAIELREISSTLDKEFVMRVLRFVLLRFSDFDSQYRGLIFKDAQEIKKEVNQLVDFLRHGLAVK